MMTGAISLSLVHDGTAERAVQSPKGFDLNRASPIASSPKWGVSEMQWTMTMLLRKFESTSPTTAAGHRHWRLWETYRDYIPFKGLHFPLCPDLDQRNGEP